MSVETSSGLIRLKNCLVSVLITKSKKGLVLALLVQVNTIIGWFRISLVTVFN